MKLSDLIVEAKKYNNVYIAGHIHPDGDCTGATIALVQIMAQAGVKAKVLLMEKPETYNYLPLDYFVMTECPCDAQLLITLDASDVERLGIFGPMVEQVKTINIDHHISNENYGDVNYVDGEASSTCEMILNMMDDKSMLNKSIAEALYTGIIYDTGGFKHSNTKPSTHLGAAALLEQGIDHTWIMNRVFYEKPFKSFKAQSLAYDRLSLYLDNRVAISYLTIQDFSDLDIRKEHIDSIVQHMNDIQGLEAAVFFYATDDTSYKVSLRSKASVDVCAVANTFGGGGHIKASGATVKGDINTCIEAVLKEIERQLM